MEQTRAQNDVLLQFKMTTSKPTTTINSPTKTNAEYTLNITDALYPGLAGDWLWTWNTCQDTNSYPYPQEAIGATMWESGFIVKTHHYTKNVFANEYFTVTDGSTPSISCGQLYDIFADGEAGSSGIITKIWAAKVASDGEKTMD